MMENKRFYHPANLDSPNYGRCLRTTRERQMFNPDSDFYQKSVGEWQADAYVWGSILIAVILVLLWGMEKFS